MPYRSSSPKARANRLVNRPQRSILEVSIGQPKQSFRDWLLVLVTALPGIAAVVALIFASASLRATNDQLQIEEKGQTIDRYNSAITNLGSTNLDVRLGGIYALQSLMVDSPSDQPSIIDVLSAYVRSHVPPVLGSTNEQAESHTFTVPIDVQAVLNVLGARNSHNDGDGIIDLQRADLPAAQFPGQPMTGNGPILAGANFENADLQGIDFSKADLAKTNFQNADLEGVDLVLANLSGAYFSGADLSFAFFPGTNVKDVNFDEVDLSYAILESSDLDGASFCGTNLNDADLTNANLEGANLFGANLQGAILSHADLRGANLEDTDLSNAKLNGANLSGDTLPRKGAVYHRPVGIVC